MESRFISQLSGRDFVQYGGLLDTAHKKGLKSIRTTLIQMPEEANGHTAICYAEVVLLQDGVEKVFTGIGDASPRNVSRNIAPHLVRMSETRSKARALRDAINVGMCSVEELGPDGELPEGYMAPPASTPGPAASAVAPAPVSVTPVAKPKAATEPEPRPHSPGHEVPYTGPNGPISTKQIKTIGFQMKRVGWAEQQGKSYLFNLFGKQSRLELSGGEANRMIDHLKTLPDARKEA